MQVKVNLHFRVIKHKQETDFNRTQRHKAALNKSLGSACQTYDYDSGAFILEQQITSRYCLLQGLLCSTG
ncbi:hypothetical protein L596_013703 [Steinernema carpocapsae]|uniref:Uncharacterized protein n=1 Tax=Steinernema carpocapsae TaxID=34508 RepID=A0A4U5P139_STECR|nr:hypothetical protein L596_013703 [Steinernema carpocapsae]